MVLYLEENDVPGARAAEYSRWLATHVTEVVAAMGRSAFASRARLVAPNGSETDRFLSVYELPSFGALESYLMSRERADLAEQADTQFPEARVNRTFAERVGQPKRGMRHGEDPTAAYVVTATLPQAEAENWLTWYEGEHMAEVLSDPGFVRARLFELHSENDGERQFLAIYDAVDRSAVEAFREGRGSKLGEAHGAKFPAARIERQIWDWIL